MFYIVFPMLVSVVIVFIFMRYQSRKAEKTKRITQEMQDSFSYYGSTLRVKKRTPKYSDILKIKDHAIETYQYNEEKLHVGAVTVGGVTTGGVYKTGGDFSSNSKNDGRCQLLYMSVSDINSKMLVENEIKEILLSNELLEEARDSLIKDYLDGNKITVVEKIDTSYLFRNSGATTIQMDRSMKNRLMAEAVSRSHIEEAQGYPSRKKCEDILNWLCMKE